MTDKLIPAERLEQRRKAKRKAADERAASDTFGFSGVGDAGGAKGL